MQTKTMSAIETVTSTLIGYLVASLANYLVLPLWGYNVSPGESMAIGLIFTIISLIRGYFVRRLFNWIHINETFKDGVPETAGTSEDR